MENGAVYDLKGHNVVISHATHKMNHILANVWENVLDFRKIKITSSDEQKLDKVYSKKIYIRAWNSRNLEN